MSTEIVNEAPSKTSILLSTRFLVTVILLFPIIMVVLGGGRAEIATFGMVMFSGPILLGLMAQRMKGRTGVAWCLLSFVVMFVANLLAGGGDSSDVLARVIMFGTIPMVVIIATLPRRKSD